MYYVVWWSHRSVVTCICYVQYRTIGRINHCIQWKKNRMSDLVFKYFDTDDFHQVVPDILSFEWTWRCTCCMDYYNHMCIQERCWGYACVCVKGAKVCVQESVAMLQLMACLANPYLRRSDPKFKSLTFHKYSFIFFIYMY